jgi:hypothetical protein
VQPPLPTDIASDPPAPARPAPDAHLADVEASPQVHDGHAVSTMDIEQDTRLLPAPDEDTHLDDDPTQTAAPEPAGPSFVRPTRRPARGVPTWHWAALAVLAAALGIQMLIADRARLAQDALWRPVLEHLCGAVRCTLPAWHQPQAYTMLARDVKPVPGVPGVLQVRATFRNDARWPQRWPAVALSLADADGRVAGARVLVPDDYLEAGQRMTTLAPGQSGQMAVQVREPAGGVVAFTFAFR